MQKICSESRLPDLTTLRRMKRPAASLAVTRMVIVVPYGSDLLMRLRTGMFLAALARTGAPAAAVACLTLSPPHRRPLGSLHLTTTRAPFGTFTTANLVNRMPLAVPMAAF